MIYPSNIPIDEIGYKLKYMVKTNSVLYKKKFVADEPLEVAFNITSGSVLDLDIWESVKGMWEKLFIEGIDTEYCLRVNTLGYKVLIDNKSKLLQAYGNQTSVSFFGKNFFPTNHNPLRHYYRAKNRILIWKRHLIKHPYYLSWDILSLLNSLFLILFFEERKFEKIKCIVKGTIDGLSN
jgi:rhamnosyltransferase